MAAACVRKSRFKDSLSVDEVSEEWRSLTGRRTGPGSAGEVPRRLLELQIRPNADVV